MISRLPWVGTRTCRVSASSGPRTSLAPSSTKSACSTSTGTVAMSPAPPLACTMLLPGATATTRPVLSTVATSGLSDFHTTRASGSGVPSSRSACGEIKTLSPGKRTAVVGIQRQRHATPDGVAAGDQHGERRALALQPRLDLGEPGGDAQHAAALRHARDGRVRAPEDELGGRDDVALAVVGRGEDGLLLADAEGHRLGRDLDFDGALSGERGRDALAPRATPRSRGRWRPTPDAGARGGPLQVGERSPAIVSTR